MGNEVHNELKKEFQLERLILFSDAVFAIAITLLIIEIKIPELHVNVSDKTLLRSLVQRIPKFIGFAVSFMLIGIYWTVHHRMFSFIINYNTRLIVFNLIFLFFIVLMPFSTGFYSEYAGPELYSQQLKVPMTFYVLNFCGVGFTNYFMWLYATNRKNKLIEPTIDQRTIKIARLRSFIVPLIFLLMLPVAYLTNVLYAMWMPMLIPIVLRIMQKRVNKKYKKH